MANNPLATLGGVTLFTREDGKLAAESIPPMKADEFKAFMDAIGRAFQSALEKQAENKC